jgi:DNA repair exonuclease SbcCD ATPase subunit
LSGNDATCTTCDQKITEDYVAKTLKAGKNLIAERTAEAAKVAEELSKIGDVDAASASITKHLNTANEKDELAKALADKVKEGKAAVGELNALGPAVDAGAPFVEPLAALDTKIKGIEEQLRPVIAAEERAEDIKKKTQAKAKLQEKTEGIDKLVDYFGKDGIKAKLLAEHVGGFENKLNATLDAWGYKCSLTIEPDFEFLVTDTDGDTNLVTELSDSEQLMFSVALQCAVSRVAGIGFIVADRMDTFADEERQKANRALYRATQDGTLEQVILLVTDKSTEVPKLPGSKFFIVEHGAVRELKVAA